MPSSRMLRRAALVRTEFLRSVLRSLITTNFFPISPILVILMMEAIHSSEMPFLPRATSCYIPVDGTLHSHRRENLKSYTVFFCSSTCFRDPNLRRLNVVESYSCEEIAADLRAAGPSRLAYMYGAPKDEGNSVINYGKD
jgi:hypothetical protein